MVHGGEQHPYGLVVSESEGRGVDAGKVIAHVKRRASLQTLRKSQTLGVVAAEVSSMHAHLSAFPGFCCASCYGRCNLQYIEEKKHH